MYLQREDGWCESSIYLDRSSLRAMNRTVRDSNKVDFIGFPPL